MSITFNLKTYTPDSYAPNSVMYIGPAQTMQEVDKLDISKTYPKPTSVFSGVSRAEFKLTRTVALTDALTSTGEIIAKLPIALPVGVSDADIDALMDDLSALVDSTEAREALKQTKVSF